MSSPSVSVSGAGQEPRIRVAPPSSETWGDLAGAFASDYGLTPDPWQQLVLNDWLGRDGDRWAASTAGLSVPRQNGKNGALEVRELFGAVGLGEKILHTAHEVKTAQKHFRRLKYFFGKKVNDPAAVHPELNALVAELRNVNGQEAIFLKNGGSIEIVARSKNSARGFTVDVIVCDEAQDMSDDDLEALKPATSSAPLGDPQRIYTGTPPGPKVNGEVFTRVRESSLTGPPVRRMWHEWSAPDGADLDDFDVWRDVNPGLITGRLLWSEVEDERGEFSDEGFARERLGRWSSEQVLRVIPTQSWEQQADEHSMATDRHTLGVEVGRDLAWASIALAGQRPDGDWHVELDDDQHTRGKGVAWLAPAIEHLLVNNPQIRSVVADVAGPIKALLEERNGRWWLKDTSEGVRIEITPVKVAELGTACSLVLSGIVTGWLWHIGQPQMSAAALAAGKRTLGDTGMWVWNRRSAESDITPVQAGTLALLGAQADKAIRPLKAAQGGRNGRRRDPRRAGRGVVIA